jgi:Protein of unknown function (DUF3300)
MTKTITAILVILLLAGAGIPGREGIAASQTPTPPSAADLDSLLAPIALYPDQLLAQMLLCASNPGKVAALSEWLASNTTLQGSELQDAALKSGFEASFVAMVLFPDVVNAMAGDLQWTTRLGEAFTANRSAVFGSVQRLRAKAKNAGTLKTTPQQEVETRTTSAGDQVIVIEPSNPQVVYVPQYNAQTVYTTPTTTSTTVVVQKDDDDDDAAVAAGLIGFTAGVAIGAAVNNNYYYGPYGWHGGAYMYNDAWDDYYDHREDAREDWADHREDLYEDRSERADEAREQRTERQQTAQEQRTERTQSRQQASPETQAQRDQRRSDAQAKAQERKSSGATAAEARGYSGESGSRATGARSGTRSDAFSGYSSGRSERAASSRGQRSRGSARGGGRRR